MTLKGAVVVEWREKESSGKKLGTVEVKKIRDSKYRLFIPEFCSCGKDRKGAVAVVMGRPKWVIQEG